MKQELSELINKYKNKEIVLNYHYNTIKYSTLAKISFFSIDEKELKIKFESRHVPKYMVDHLEVEIQLRPDIIEYIKKIFEDPMNNFFTYVFKIELINRKITKILEAKDVRIQTYNKIKGNK